jgi:hypothetical protein
LPPTFVNNEVSINDDLFGSSSPSYNNIVTEKIFAGSSIYPVNKAKTSNEE